MVLVLLNITINLRQFQFLVELGMITITWVLKMTQRK